VNVAMFSLKAGEEGEVPRFYYSEVEWGDRFYVFSQFSSEVLQMLLLF
jgi:hypothetical protein